MRWRHLTRHGRYYRVCDPHWHDCTDTSYSKTLGGRWNPAGEFGALYLCRTLAVAGANARQNFAGEMHSLYDLKPESRPVVLEFSMPERSFVDAVSDAGLVTLGLPRSYPKGLTTTMMPTRCRAIGKAAYAATERGIACRSAAEATLGPSPGEELVVFDRSTDIVRRGRRRAFDDWYPAAR